MASLRQSLILAVLVLFISVVFAAHHRHHKGAITSAPTSARLPLEPLNVTRVKFVDRVGQNWLFRGNEPTDANHEFVYDELVSYLRSEAVAATGNDLPDDFFIVDISFIWLPDELTDLHAEENFCKDNNTLCQLIHWPIYGDLVSPFSLPSTYADDHAVKLPDWQIDRLDIKSSDLRNWLTTQSDVPTVFYGHCEHGVDRTGEVFGSYYLRYLDWSLPQVLAYNDAIIDRDEMTINKNAIRWFCLYLKYGEKQDIDCSPS